jgi:hypothetical protein
MKRRIPTRKLGLHSTIINAIFQLPSSSEGLENLTRLVKFQDVTRNNMTVNNFVFLVHSTKELLQL